MSGYHVGDPVEVAATALDARPGSRPPILPSRQLPSPWLPAVIEGIHADPGAEAAERYRVRIVAGDRRDARGEVSLAALRPPTSQKNRPADAASHPSSDDRTANH